MYLHLGQNTVVTLDEIIGIFDIDNTTVSKRTKKYLEKADKEKRIYNIATDIPKSFIVCQDTEKIDKIYLSQISPTTLVKRSSYMDSLIINSNYNESAGKKSDE